MRIDLRTAYDTGADDQTQKTPAKSGAQKPQAPDATELSSDIRLSGLLAKAAAAPDVRQERVDQLRQAIASGTYSVSDEQLADAMLRDLMQR